ncbi:hypothetical protein [Ammoniphilus sp. CFH 90114]|uniref:hypothetical protein n=1 Tax=Ammoniphilus sp. CFH 90114 TaxID=2493665 RepID=UPI00100FB7FD|nr:hypothetical protein [Ammoniphilus sp. CFH 90114]RXT04781.1 hypothetical protein EIZ39_18820 [Ammoniphilus sp. CFH 90114]
MLPTSSKMGMMVFTFLLFAVSLTSCGYADGRATTQNNNQTYTDQPYQNPYDYRTVNDPDLDNIHDSPFMKAQQLRAR